MSEEQMHIHGGIVQSVKVAGDCVIHGGIVQKLIVTGNCTQYGGIINQRVQMTNPEQPPNSAAETKQPYTAEPEVRIVEKVVYRDRIKEVVVDRLPEESIEELQKLRKEVKYFSKQCHKLQYDIELRENVIQKLETRLTKALNRERVAVLSRKDAERELSRVLAHQWDDYRPTKEEVKRYYNVILALLDCEETN